MLAFLGRADAVLAVTGGITGHGGITGIETQMAIATAHLLQGRTTRALSLLDDVEQAIRPIPEVWSDELRDGLLGTRCAAMMSGGLVSEASALVRANLPLGSRSIFGFLPSIAALTEVSAGRPRAALEILYPVTQASARKDFPQYAAIARAIELFTRSLLPSERLDSAEWSDVFDETESLSGELRWLSRLSLAMILPQLKRVDEAPAMLDEVAESAGAAGAGIRVAEALTLSLTLGVAAEPESVIERLETVVARFEGRYWPARVAHARAAVHGDGVALDAVQREYVDIGYPVLTGRPHFTGA